MLRVNDKEPPVVKTMLGLALKNAWKTPFFKKNLFSKRVGQGQHKRNLVSRRLFAFL